MGTNPIAVGVPSDEPFPFLFDASTSVVTRGKIEVAARAKKPIPPGWVIGRDGQAITESTTLIEKHESRHRRAAADRRPGRTAGRPQGLRPGGHGRDLLRRLPAGGFPVRAARHGLRRATRTSCASATSSWPSTWRASCRWTSSAGRWATSCASCAPRAKAPGEEQIYTAGEKAYANTAAGAGRGGRDRPGRAAGAAQAARRTRAAVRRSRFRLRQPTPGWVLAPLPTAERLPDGQPLFLLLTSGSARRSAPVCPPSTPRWWSRKSSTRPTFSRVSNLGSACSAPSISSSVTRSGPRTARRRAAMSTDCCAGTTGSRVPCCRRNGGAPSRM